MLNFTKTLYGVALIFITNNMAMVAFSVSYSKEHTNASAHICTLYRSKSNGYIYGRYMHGRYMYGRYMRNLMALGGHFHGYVRK